MGYLWSLWRRLEDFHGVGGGHDQHLCASGGAAVVSHRCSSSVDRPEHTYHDVTLDDFVVSMQMLYTNRSYPVMVHFLIVDLTAQREFYEYGLPSPCPSITLPGRFYHACDMLPSIIKTHETISSTHGSR